MELELSNQSPDSFKLEIPFIEDWKLITEFVLAKSILGLIFGYK